MQFLEDINPQTWTLLSCGIVVVASAVVLLRWVLDEAIPDIKVDATDVTRSDADPSFVEDNYIYIHRKGTHSSERVQCCNPANFKYYGFVPALKPAQVEQHVKQARVAQAEWSKHYKKDRKRLLKILLKYIVKHQEVICRVSAQDSGKVMVDAVFGEILTTCEKINWLLKEGDKWLETEYRSVGAMMLHKTARVEYQPLGVLGAIVPWNYPFHNIFNPMLSAVFAGNAIVIKVSEHASWSAKFYERIITGALMAVGAPKHLVHVISGYAETGEALVKSSIDKLTFVGSTGVGKKVMEAASENLTPVVLELGGKDPFIVCDDADLDQVIPIALRGAFQCSGQNCVGAERFYVHSAILDKFVSRVVDVVNRMTMGDPLGGTHVDMGAICMPHHSTYLQELVDDALAKGATIAAGGTTPAELGGQFFAPTVLVGVDHSMRITREEAFGPIMVIMQFSDDDQAVRLANDSAFALGASVFSRTRRRANRIAARLRCGMVNINDFNATYMCQSLPFGGLKQSGFDRFAGVEGLRGCCLVKAITEDRLPFIKTHLPKPLQYPLDESGLGVVKALCRFFYSPGLIGRVRGLLDLLMLLTSPAKRKENDEVVDLQEDLVNAKKKGK